MPKQFQYTITAIALIIVAWAIFDTYTSINRAGSQTREAADQIDQSLQKARQSP